MQRALCPKTIPNGEQFIIQFFVFLRPDKGKTNGKAHFIGCSNWSLDDGLSHRITRIPSNVRESIVIKLFKGEIIDEDDDDHVDGPCRQVFHPSHLPKGKKCREYHYLHIRSRAKLLQLVHIFVTGSTS